MRNAVTFVTLAAVALCSTAWQVVGPVQPAQQKSRIAKKPVVPDGPKPKIKLSAEVWDFGEVIYGDTPSQVFTITNEGDADLIIDRVKGSCSCTVPKLKVKLLKPGESTEVTVNFNTKKRQGQISTLVQIRSNDPLRPLLSYRVKGTVNRLIGLKPTSISLSGLKRDELMSGTIRITNQSGEPIKPEFKSINSDYFDVTINEVEAGKIYDVVVNTKPPIPYGRTRGVIEIATGNARQPEIKIPVNANVRARVSVTPPIVFVPKQTKSPSKRRIRVRYFGTDENFQVLSVESSDSTKLPVTLLPLSDEQKTPSRLPAAFRPKIERVISVEVPAGAELGDDGLEIVIYTNDPEFEKLVVPVTGNPNTFRQSLGLRAQAPRPVKPAIVTPGAGGASKSAAGVTIAKPAAKPDAEKDDKPDVKKSDKP
ncbi:MAG: DUF1573 domain-containing protein [Planctomycetes bacterium]|nr:DUF1573 domain-containing protein [Planctomycetota bacterium]